MNINFRSVMTTLLVWLFSGLLFSGLQAQVMVQSDLEKWIAEKYSIVEADGKYAIYDQEKQQPVTAFEMDLLSYSHYAQPEEDTTICFFYFERGYMQGLIGVHMNDNTTMEISNENPKYVASLDACTTVDTAMQQYCLEQLQKALLEMEGTRGQIAVLDAETAQLLAWTAVERDGQEWKQDPLFHTFCSNLILRPVASLLFADDEDRRRLAEEKYGNGVPQSNAKEWATLFNYFYHKEHLMVPTLVGDSVRVNGKADLPNPVLASFRKEYRENCLEIGEPNRMAVAGFCEQIPSENGQLENSFVGCYPVDQPSVTVCMIVFSDAQSVGCAPQLIPYIRSVFEYVTTNK